jgi:hypothetical protein
MSKAKEIKSVKKIKEKSLDVTGKKLEVKAEVDGHDVYMLYERIPTDAGINERLDKLKLKGQK